MATLAAVTHIPALALLGEDGSLEHSTETFRRWYEDKRELCLAAPELMRVLEAQANAAVLKLDGIAVDIAAVADRQGGRHVLLTLPTGELPSLGDPGEALLLDGALDESPALVWLKDLEGRYVRVNARFTSVLGTSEERLLGRTENELPPAETVDGPRAQDRPEGVEEPLQLEYMVGAYQGRDAFVVLRFPVANRQGVPTLVCGVAAPAGEAQLARSEAARLLRVERWGRLDADSVRAELLADWGVLPDVRGTAAAAASVGAPASGSGEHEAAVAEARAERATAVAERDSALAANEQLTAELGEVQGRLVELERALQSARAEAERGDAEAKLAEQAAELDRALARERERAEELERTLALVRQRLGDDAEAARVEVQRARADAEAARTELDRAREDAQAARQDLDKTRAEANAMRQQLAALERRQSDDDSGAQLVAAEKARAAAEIALADAVAERDAALKARAVIEGQLAAGAERERLNAAGLEEAQARIRGLEGELRAAAMRADKAEVEFSVAAGRVEKLEAELAAAVARADEARGDDSGAQLVVVEKAREAAEAALAGAVAERDAALKARVVLEAELEQERQQVAALRESAGSAEERIRELAGGMERERVRAAGLEQAQARAQALEGELRVATMRADKAEVEVEHWRSRVKRVESELERAQAQIERAEAELAAGRTRLSQAEASLEAGRARIGQLEGEVERGRARIGQLEGELEVGRARVGQLEGELEVGRARVGQLEGELELGRARVEELGASLEARSARVDELEGELEAARASEEAARAGEEAARASEEAAVHANEEGQSAVAGGQAGRPGESPVEEIVPTPAPAAGAAEPQPGPAGPGVTPAGGTAAELAPLEAVHQVVPAAGAGVSWQPTAKRTLSASLARESVWRNVLKETVEVLGREGGWDTVTAWVPDDSDALGCAATWTAHRGLERFEALTWEAELRRDGSLLDQALQAPHLTWLTDIDAVDDERLQSASAHGMSSALLLPIRSGTTTIGLLELLTHDSIEPDAQIALSLEAATLQLGRFGHLLSLGGKRS